tara:strand:- start:194 stop:1021 length:828 start_codon:yes stop_codon:yes gene_type:complete
MKIYDCITYCGEDLLLKIRLETLYDDVDKFVIVEANKYFDGEKKQKFFDIKKFEKYKSKIDFHFIEDLPKYNGKNIEYEYFIKNQIKRGLKDLDPEDIILFSDVDEIPNLKNKKFKEFDSSVFLTNMYYYKFNIHVYSGLKWSNKWPGTKSCKFKFFKSAIKLRELRVKNIPWWRYDQKINRYVIKNGGWHFSFLMNSKEISSKLKRFTHEIEHVKQGSNYDLMNIINIENIENRILNLIDPYERKDIKLKKVKLDSSFPKYIIENVEKLTDYIV